MYIQDPRTPIKLEPNEKSILISDIPPKEIKISWVGKLSLIKKSISLKF